MVSLLGELVRNLLVILFLNVLLEMLLPRGQYHRYIRLITGLVVILLVVNAMAGLLGRGPSVATLLPQQGPLPDIAAPQQSNLIRVSREQTLSLYREALQQLAREEVEAGGQWQLVSARFTLEENPGVEEYGAIYGIELQVQAAGGAERAVEPVDIASITASGSGAEQAETPEAGKQIRVETLEQKVARRFQVSPELVCVTVK
ncbi:MAG TPA: stage III sporulation protein AF [Bacillota bacterium]|nr:stage III sporulation protein AF [Bacillota bacterium]